jgi:hypothetical protein
VRQPEPQAGCPFGERDSVDFTEHLRGASFEAGQVVGAAIDATAGGSGK